MTANRRINLGLVLLAIVAGLFIGMQLDQQNLQVAQAASQERGLAAMQAARGAMDIVKYDMARAGYVEMSPASPMSRAVSFRVTPNEPLQLGRVTVSSIEFRSPDGRENITYRFQAGHLIRSVSGKESEHLVLLDKVSSFKMQVVQPGQAVNLAFAVSGTGAAPVFAHFVNSSQQ